MEFLTASEKKEILPFAQGFIERAKQDMKEIGDRFFFLGCRLYEAKIYHYVEALGYESIEQLAEVELDLGKSSTYNLINVFKRFCDRDEYRNYKTWIAPQYRKYKYSQLVEMEKAYCLSNNIEKEIPPETPVRVIKEYIKYLNKNPGMHKTLPEWKNEQEKAIEASAITPQETDDEIRERARKQAHEAGIPFYDGDMDEDFNPYVYDGNMSVEDYKLMHQHMDEDRAVQTFGLQDTAEAKTENPEPKKEKPTYNFTTRAGVRAFLADYKNWKKYSKSWNSIFFKNVYGYTFKNRKYIMACERTVFEGADFDINITVIQPVYYLSNNYGIVEISKNQFEQYCAEHKDEL